MDIIHSPRVAQALKSLPSGPARELALHRLAAESAADEATSALRHAAQRVRGIGGPLADALTALVELHDAAAAVSSPAFLALIPGWIKDLREIASTRPETGACTVASGMQIWLWTMNHFKDTEQSPVVAAELAEAFTPLLAARCRILELSAASADDEGRSLALDLCHTYGAHAAAAAGSVCAELVFGYRRHLSWDAEGCAACYNAGELDELEGLMPGIASTARGYADVIEADGAHAAKAGPCATFDGVETFTRLRARLDGCLTGARRAKERAAAALPDVYSNAPAGLAS